MRAAAKVVYLCLCHYFNGRYSSIVARKVNSNKKPFAGKVNKLVMVTRRDCVHNLSLGTQKVWIHISNSKWVENERKCFKLILQSYCSLNCATLTVSFINELFNQLIYAYGISFSSNAQTLIHMIKFLSNKEHKSRRKRLYMEHELDRLEKM